MIVTYKWFLFFTQKKSADAEGYWKATDESPIPQYPRSNSKLLRLEGHYWHICQLLTTCISKFDMSLSVEL